jgi:hypothetical protein
MNSPNHDQDCDEQGQRRGEDQNPDGEEAQRANVDNLVARARSTFP